MSIATDTVSYLYSWIAGILRPLVLVGLALGSLILVFSFGIFLAGRFLAALLVAPVANAGLHHFGFYRAGTGYPGPTASAFLKARPSKWLVLKPGGRYCGREHSCFARHFMEAIPPQVVFMC